MQLWEVVGGTGSGGIVVRMGRPLDSEQFPQRLSTGALVRELAVTTSRLHYELVTGEGPPSGWVSIRITRKDLLQRRGPSSERAPSESGTTASSPSLGVEPRGGFAECLPIGFDDRVEDRCDRIIVCPLGSGGRAPVPLASSPCCFRRVCVFGPHHSCTGALMRELPRFFDVSVQNVHYEDSPDCWKHTVFKEPLEVPEDVFFICLVKEPAFWIQSLGRDPAEGTFYEIQPVETVVLDGGELGLEEQLPSSRAQLFSPVVLDGVLYPDALAIWEATIRAYLDESILPSDRTAAVRCEDFLFNFGAVMTALASRGLPPRELGGSSYEWEPLENTAKDQTHPSCTRRGRRELLCYYEEPTNRFAGLTQSQILRLRRLAPDVLRTFRYGDDAPVSWIPIDEN